MSVTAEDKARIRDEALDWLVRVHAPGADGTVRADAMHWAGQSAGHAAAWRRAERAWALTGELPEPDRAAWPEAPPARILPPRRRWLYGSSGAAAVAACLTLFFTPLGLALRADHATGTGEIRQIALEDGSIVHLDTGSAVDVAYSASERRVTLLAGRAYFDVRRDSARPFLVDTDGADVRVLGTAFDVAMMPDEVDVAVARGLVRTTPDLAPANAAELRPGERARVDRRTGSMSRDHLSATRIAPWRDGLIVVDGASIADVIGELRRYHSGLIVLRNEALGRKRVTGVYDVRDPEAALRAILLPHGGKLSRYTGYILVVSAN